MHYECALCHNEFVQTNVQVDHINPAVDPLIGFVSWDEFINRLFCPASNLQVLCIQCHLTKTKAERLAAKLYKMQRPQEGDSPLLKKMKGKQK